MCVQIFPSGRSVSALVGPERQPAGHILGRHAVPSRWRFTAPPEPERKRPRHPAPGTGVWLSARPGRPGQPASKHVQRNPAATQKQHTAPRIFFHQREPLELPEQVDKGAACICESGHFQWSRH